MKYSSLKSICLSLIIMLLVMSLVPTLAEGPKGAYVVDKVFLGGGRLNVHETPNLDDVVDGIEEGTVVRYQYSENGWWHVEYWKGKEDIREGFVDGDFLSSIVSNAGSTLYTSVCGVYVHSTSKIEYGHCDEYHIGKLKKGQLVTVLEQDGTWSRINYNGNTGWVPSIYLEKAG